MMSCRYAKLPTDTITSISYECDDTGCGCRFLEPDENACYKIFGIGPIADDVERSKLKYGERTCN